jgi:p-hydroxybenzoic acid efflux pump subunit AaeB
MLSLHHPADRAAIRTAIAVVLAVYIAFFLHFDNPYWSGMTIILINNLYVANVLERCFLRIVGTGIGVLVGGGLAVLVVNVEPYYFLSIFCIIAFATYQYHTSRYGYAYIAGALGAFLVLAQLNLGIGNVLNIMIWRFVEISLGVLCQAVCSVLILPNSIEIKLKQDEQHILQTVLQLLDELNKILLAEKTSFDIVKAAHVNLKQITLQLQETLAIIQYERILSHTEIANLERGIGQFYELARVFSYWINTLEMNSISSFSPEMKKSAAAMVEQLIQIIRNMPSGMLWRVETLQMRSLDRHLQHFVKTWLKDTTLATKKREAALFLYAMITDLQDVFVQAFSKKTQIDAHYQLEELTMKRDPDLIIMACKVGVIACMALWLWMYSGWPGGYIGIVSVLILSMRQNELDHQMAGFQRFMGCLVGGACVLILLMFEAFTLYDFTLCLFFGVLFFTLIYFRSKSHAYFGMQASIALVIALSANGETPYLVNPVLERLGGVGIELISSVLVFSVFWRMNWKQSLAGRLDRLEVLLQSNIQQIFTHTGAGIKLYELKNLFWNCRLRLSWYKSVASLKTKTYERLMNRFEHLLSVQSAINYTVHHIDSCQLAEGLQLLGINQLDVLQFDKLLIMRYSRSAFELLDTKKMSFQVFQQTTRFLLVLMRLKSMLYQQKNSNLEYVLLYKS